MTVLLAERSMGIKINDKKVSSFMDMVWNGKGFVPYMNGILRKTAENARCLLQTVLVLLECSYSTLELGRVKNGEVDRLYFTGCSKQE